MPTDTMPAAVARRLTDPDKIVVTCPRCGGSVTYWPPACEALLAALAAWTSEHQGCTR